MKIVLPDWSTISNGDIDSAVFKKYGEAAVYPLTSPEELPGRIEGAEMVLCNKTVFDRRVLEKADSLRYIGLFATGYNNIDVGFARQRGITVCNAGSYSTMAVAQHTFALILECFSGTSSYLDFTRKGGWLSSPTFSPFVFEQHELWGKTLGIIGYGQIGKQVGRIAEAFGMKTLIHTRTPGEDERFVPLEELLGRSDVITVHTPLTPETERLINRETLLDCRKGVIIINTSRGGVIDEPALADALRSGQVKAAYLDVLTTEPMSPECPLIGAPNLHLTPHIAWAPIETRLRLMDVVCRNIEAFLDGRPINVVN